MSLHSAASHQGWRPSGSAVYALLAGAFAFSLMTVCVKELQGRLPVAEIVMGRALVSVALSAALVRRAGLDPWGQRRGLLAVRGLVGTMALFCVYQGVMRLPLAAATVLQFLYPTITALLAWRLLGEKPGGWIGLAMAMGWLGVLVMVSPLGLGKAAAPLAADGVGWAVAGALLTAMAYVSVRELGRSEHPQVIVLWFPLISLPLCLPLVALDPVLPSPADLGWLVGVGLLTQLGQIGLTHGLVQMPAAQATTVSYAQVGFAGLWGWLLFGEPVALPTVAGAALILSSILLSRGRLPDAPQARLRARAPRSNADHGDEAGDG